MEQPNAKKWYDNNALVAVLCFVFFPVGLYALWKSSLRSSGWKIGGTIAVAVLVIVAANRDVKKPEFKESKSAEIHSDTLQPDATVPQVDTSVVAVAEPVETDQEDFMDTKIRLFADYIHSEPVIEKRSGTIASFKTESIKATKSFLKERNNQLVKWSARVIDVDMDQAKECDISLSLHPETRVGSKTVGGKTMDCRITVEAIQATLKSIGTKGLIRKGSLYDTVKALKPNDDVILTAKVVHVEENSEATGLNYSIVLYVELEDIRKR
ncbi:MAG: hypothetical protein K8H89_02905 [Flavobacteriales bacterium]|jgi:hypothetical protein|nr:hypothetical protein [Flavobacteriales bacterium]